MTIPLLSRCPKDLFLRRTTRVTRRGWEGSPRRIDPEIHHRFQESSCLRSLSVLIFLRLFFLLYVKPFKKEGVSIANIERGFHRKVRFLFVLY